MYFISIHDHAHIITDPSEGNLPTNACACRSALRAFLNLLLLPVFLLIIRYDRKKRERDRHRGREKQAIQKTHKLHTGVKLAQQLQPMQYAPKKRL